MVVSPMVWPPEGGRIGCLANYVDLHHFKEVEQSRSVTAQGDAHLFHDVRHVWRVAEYDGAAATAAASEPRQAVQALVLIRLGESDLTAIDGGLNHPKEEVVPATVIFAGTPLVSANLKAACL
tara:strand:+ start:1516 stop:1884 length:369 start_codon:yes stop_codon:yes gene_type:complete